MLMMDMNIGLHMVKHDGYEHWFTHVCQNHYELCSAEQCPLVKTIQMLRWLNAAFTCLVGCVRCRCLLLSFFPYYYMECQFVIPCETHILALDSNAIGPKLF